jgi:isopenicillin N synthase-like dioxygenase
MSIAEADSAPSPLADQSAPGPAPALPILDLARFGSSDAPDREAFLDELRHAAHEVGFFYVTGHGVPPAVSAAVLDASRAFFALPLEDRLAVENVNSAQFRGYTREGTEYTAGSADRRDQLDVGLEREPLDLGPDDPAYLRLVGPNQWPQGLPGFKPAVLAWLAEGDRVSRVVLRAVAAALGQPEDYFDGWFDDEAVVHLKVLRYRGLDDGEPGHGVGAHKDYGYLALLLQDDYGGLQVEGADGRWFDAPPLRDAFVVNIGELLEVATQGYLRATRHRVLSPPAGVERFSVPFFLGPRLDAVVEELTLPEELAVHARGVEQDPDNVLRAEYGEKVLVSWLRSHPRVARRWHADLLTEDATAATP